MQRGRGKFTKALHAGIQLIERLAKSNLGKRLWGEALRYASTFFEKGVTKIKNDKVRRVLNSDLANAVVNYWLDYAKNKFHKY